MKENKVVEYRARVFEHLSAIIRKSTDLNRRAVRRGGVLVRARMVYFSGMNESDLNEIKDIVDSALGTHLASVHEEITDLRNELKQDLSGLETTLTAKIDRVDEKLGNFDNREIDKRLQLEVRVGRLEKQRS